jgi:hypothetical protein
MPPRCNVKGFRGSRPGLDAKRGLPALLLFAALSSATAVGQWTPQPVFTELFAYDPAAPSQLLGNWRISSQLVSKLQPLRVGVVEDSSGKTVGRVTVQEGDGLDDASDAMLRARRYVCDREGSRAAEMEAGPGGVVPSERAEIQVRSDRATGAGELVKFGQPVWYRFSFKIAGDFSGSLITKDRTETSAGLRIPAVEIDQIVSGRVHRWLLDPGNIYKSTSGRLVDTSVQQRLLALAADIGKHWPELPVARKRAVLAALIERIEVKVDQIDIHLRPLRLCALLDLPATPSQSVNDDEIELLSVPVRLRRSGREIRMVIDGPDPFAAKPDARLIRLLLRARRFNATLAHGEGVPFAALADREGVSRSYFTRLVRLSRQPPDLTAEKLLEHSRLPLAWHDQRTVLGFA